MKRRGNSIATTLIVAALVLTLGFTLAAAGFMHLNVSSKLSNHQRATELAEATLCEAVERIARTQGSFGSSDNPTFSEPVEVELPGMPEGAAGRLAFDPEVAGDLGIPWSVNRFQQDPAPGWGNRMIPRDCFQLIATGNCNGVQRSVEAVIQVPPYPFALGSTGAITSNGRVVVGTVADPTRSPLTVDPDQLLPGHLASNSEARPCVSLGSSSLVTGNLLGVGSVDLDPSVVVRGEVRSNSDPAGLPRLDLATLDTAGKGPQQLDASITNMSEEEALEGPYRAQGRVDVNGDLYLQNAEVFIDGDLVVSGGGLRGKGMVVCSGDVTIDGGTALSGGDQAALVAGGDVTLKGDGASTKSFKGLVYCEGHFQAQQISVVGAAVANGTDSDIRLADDVGMGYYEPYTRIRLLRPNAFRYAWPNASSAMLTVTVGPYIPGTPFSPSNYRIQPSTAYINARMKTPGDPPGTAYFRDFTSPAAAAVFMQDIADYYYTEIYGPTGVGSSPYMAAQITEFIAALQNPTGPGGPLNTSGLPDPYGASRYVPAFASAFPSNNVSFDLSDFLSFEDRMKVRLWREF